MQIPFLDLKIQYQQIKDEILPIFHDIMANAMFIGGPQVTGFEQEFADFCETRYCAGVASGTDALRFALMAAGIGPGHEVITVPNTFIATSESITQTGATPVFVDVYPDTSNIDVQQIESKITSKTKAIVPVHLYGQPADMDPILEIAQRYGLEVIEDACQAHGALYKGKKAGSIGLAGCFSFYPGKNLGAFGEAGAVVSNDETLIQKIKVIRDHGQATKYFHDMEGYNGRLDALQAAVLRVKLKKLAAWNQSRRQNAALYTRLLSEIPEIETPVEKDFANSVYHLYVIQTKHRDNLMKHLNEKNIGTGLHYPLPLHQQKAYQHAGYRKGDFPVSEKLAGTLLSLPMYPELTEEKIEYVVDSIKNFVSAHRW
jgi:dTDP-4-amino-4,6-dideoxygalactose transaminase